MQVKLITSYMPNVFERDLNNFIAQIGSDKIIDIKYGGAATVLSSPVNEARHYSALILYKE